MNENERESEAPQNPDEVFALEGDDTETERKPKP